MQIQRMLTRCSMRNLSVIAWSLATLRYRPHRGLLLPLVRIATQRMEGRSDRRMSGGLRGYVPEVAPRGIANLLWALATLKASNGPEGLPPFFWVSAHGQSPVLYACL